MTNNTGTAPLSVEVTRQEMHSRLIDMRGWGQSDGPYEVEGRVVDRKPHEFKSPNGFKVVPAGEPIHDMVFSNSMRCAATSKPNSPPKVMAATTRVTAAPTPTGWATKSSIARTGSCSACARRRAPLPV